MSDEWRMLGPEEVIQEGDEMFLKGPGRWEKVTYSIGKKPFIFPTYQVRRRVSTLAAAEIDWQQRAEKAEALQREAASALQWANEMLKDYRAKLHQAEKERDQLRAELKTLADRFKCPVEHAVTVALTFATTTDGVLNGLRAENERLLEALGKIAKKPDPSDFMRDYGFILRDIAQQALAKGETK